MKCTLSGTLKPEPPACWDATVRQFTCSACGRKGAEVRADLDWDKEPGAIDGISGLSWSLTNSDFGYHILKELEQ